MAKEKICGIYKITNTVNNKVYIGQSIDIYARWKAHKKAYRSTTNSAYHLPLYCAFREYGEENFVFDIIERCQRNELNDEERRFIEQYQSDNPDYGYNDSHRDYRFPTREKIATIRDLLKNSGLFMDEIAIICNQSNSTVRKINEGTSYHQDEISYPIRSLEDKELIHRMRYKQCRPPIEFRQHHSASESYEEYKNLCRRKNAEGEKVPIIFDEDIDIDFIDELLSNPLPDIADKYGYKDVTRIQNHLKTVGLPHKLADLQIYYEQQTGRPHKTSMSERKRSRGKIPRISRPVAQYDGNTRKLVNVFLTQSQAAKAIGVPASNVMNAVAENGRIKKCSGYFWRALDLNGNIICPSEYSDYSANHHNACIACGAEIPEKSDSQYCDVCENIRSKATTSNQLLEKDWLLYCLARCTYNALAVIYNISPSTAQARAKVTSVTSDELASAREEYQHQKLDALRAIVPQVLLEGM